MTEKEDFYTRNPHALDGHPTLEPRMRTILLGWLMEVSSKFRLVPWTPPKKNDGTLYIGK